MDETITALEASVARLHDRAVKLADDEWTRTVVIGDEEVDVEWIVGHAVHDATHHLRDVGRGLAALGAGAPTQYGSIAQVERVERRCAQATRCCGRRSGAEVSKKIARRSGGSTGGRSRRCASGRLTSSTAARRGPSDPSGRSGREHHGLGHRLDHDQTGCADACRRCPSRDLRVHGPLREERAMVPRS